ncbi:MAG: ribosomal protein S18-alanine N-acetyltransferase [Candidatus Zixiibacteriota bacterium]
MPQLRGLKVSNEVQIERMSSKDIDEIVWLEKESFTDPWPRKAFEIQLGDGSSIMLAARAAAGGIVGYLCAYLIFEELQLASVAVKEGFRRQGIARRLILEMTRQGRGAGAKEIWLDVRESNEAARRLYEELGFKEVYRRKNYYRKPKEDALVLFRSVEETVVRPAERGTSEGLRG